MAKSKKNEEKEDTQKDASPKVRVAKFMASVCESMKLDDEKGQEAYPNLFDHLAPIYEDGALKRAPGALRLTIEGGYYRISVSCPTEKVETTFVARSLVGLIDDLERYLSMPTSIAYKPIWEKNKKKLPTIDDLIK